MFYDVIVRVSRIATQVANPIVALPDVLPLVGYTAIAQFARATPSRFLTQLAWMPGAVSLFAFPLLFQVLGVIPLGVLDYFLSVLRIAPLEICLHLSLVLGTVLLIPFLVFRVVSFAILSHLLLVFGAITPTLFPLALLVLGVT